MVKICKVVKEEVPLLNIPSIKLKLHIYNKSVLKYFI